ncbi:MAG: hypothetical protein C0394_10850 [Syntrophus sp. (in: bacteria)]|nr:hypothetical protein [Syntrophus sp. (in: bacteria)]
MIETTTFEDVMQIRMSREIDGKPVYWVAAYLIDGLLIDAGCSYTAEELVAFLGGRDVRQVVNTHFHEDHVGANHILKTRLGLDIYAPHGSVPLIGQAATLFPYQEMVWGYPLPTDVRPLPPVVRTQNHIFDVIETPGHSEGHAVLVEKARGWCFSGDIFARERMKFIRPEEDMGETVASMRRLIALPTERLILFTSVGRIVEDGRQALQECILYLEDLSGQAKALSQQGLGVPEVVRKMFGGEHGFAELTNGQYTSENLVRSVLKMGN